MLVAAMNPCPCGYFGDLKRECRCGTASGPALSTKNFRTACSIASIFTSKSPLLNTATFPARAPKKAPPPSAIALQRARERQHIRFGSDTKINCNARMGPRQIKQHCQLTDESQELIRVAMTELNLSARAYDRILKVSRTVADLAGSESITPEHVSEAIQYRTFDRTLWV